MKDKKEKKSAWGKGITILYSSFVVFILSIVIYAAMQDFHLVEKNYYQQELAYQDRMEQIKNNKDLKEKPVWSINRDAKIIVFKFPESLVEKDLEGEILFFRPSDATRDIRVDVETDPSGLQIIPIDNLIPGLWKIKLKWQTSEKVYYFEDSFVIQEEV